MTIVMTISVTVVLPIQILTGRSLFFLGGSELRVVFPLDSGEHAVWICGQGSRCRDRRYR